MNLLQELIESIWQPGVNRGLLYAIHATFGALFFTNLAVFILLPNWSVFAMIVLSVLLYLTLLWFIKEADLMNTNEGCGDNDADSSQRKGDRNIKKKE